MERFLNRFIKLLIGVSFFVPLLVIPSSYIFPFIVPKIIVFRSVTLLMLGAYLTLLFTNWKEYAPRKTWLNLGVLLLFLSMTISTFVGVDWYRSFWDNHERMLGLFTLTHYLLYYVIITSVIKDRNTWTWLLRTFLLAGSLVMLIGFWQYFIDPNALLNRGAARVSATLGNAIYYSGYGFFLFFVGYTLMMRERERLGKLLAAVGALLGFIGVFLGGTRGTVLGLAVALLVGGLVYLFTLKEYPKTRRALQALFVIFVVIGVLLFAFRTSEFVKNIPGVGRLVNVDISSGTAGTRLMAWEIAIDGWKEKPVFGWGINNYYYAFNKYYNPAFLEHGWGETWFDNAHNAFINALAARGIVGLFTTLGLFLGAAWMLIRGFRQGRIDAHLFAAGLAFLAGHFVHNIFVFENPTSYLYFFFFLAFINAETIAPRSERGRVNSGSYGLAGVVFFLVFLILYSTNINPSRANQQTLQTIRALSQGDVSGGIAAYQMAAKTPSPHIDDIRNDFARTANQQIVALAQKKQTKQALELYELAKEELTKNLALHPLDIRIHIQLAQLLQIAADIKQDRALIVEAESFLEEARTLSPDRQQLQYTLAGIKLMLGKNDEAIALLQTSIDNDPIIAEGWWRLGFVYKHLGQQEKAAELISEARAAGAKFGTQDEQMAKSLIGTLSTTTTP